MTDWAAEGIIFEINHQSVAFSGSHKQRSDGVLQLSCCSSSRPLVCHVYQKASIQTSNDNLHF